MASLGRLLWRWTAGIFSALAILLALAIGAFRIAVTEVPEYRQPVADWASRTLGLQVDIGHMDARLRLGGPELVIENADIRPADGGEVLLSAERAAISLDLMTLLLRWKVEPDAFTLEGVELELERDAEGRLSFLGHGLDDLPEGEAGLRGVRLRLRDSSLVVRDGMPGGQRWRFTGLSVDLALDQDGMRIDGSFRPTGDVAGPVAFWLTADRGASPVAWEGYLGLQDLDLAALRRIPGLPGPVPAAGRLDGRFWLGLAGARPVRVSAELDVRDLVLSGDGARYDALAGRLEWDRQDAGWVATADGLQVARQGREWRLASGRLEYGGGDPRVVYVDADRLRLEDLAPLAELLPARWTGDWLDGLAPRGDVSGLTARLRLPAGDADGAAPSFEVQATLDKVGVDAWDRWPGVAGLSGELRGDEQSGRLSLASQGLVLRFPRLFRDPLAVDTASGLLLWRRGADGLTLIGDGLALANADAGVSGGFRIRPAGADNPGLIEIRAEVTDADAAATSRYLPVGIMPDNVVRWLDRAVVSGRVPGARVDVQGPLKGFPYRDGQGVLQVSFGTRDLVLDYAPGWPRAEGVAADLLFRNEGLSATVHEGRLAGVPVTETTARIPDLPKGRLRIEGGLAGTLPQLMGFVAASPLAGVLGEGFMATRFVDGRGEARVDLLLPIRELGKREVAVDLSIRDGVLGYGELPWRLDSVAGEIAVRGTEVTAEGVTGQLFGENLDIRIGPAADGATRAWVEGPLTRDMLVSGLGLPLGHDLEGDTRFTGYAHFPGRGGEDRFRMHAGSNLEGMAVSLPAPLAKDAGEAVPLAMDFEFPREGITDWRADYGDRLAAALRFSTSEGGLAFQRGLVAAGADATTLPQAPGLHLSGHVPTLDLDAWLALETGGGGRGPALRDLLTGGRLRADHLRIAGQHFADARLGLGQEAEGWRFTVEAPGAAGEGLVPYTEGAMDLRFTRLYLDDEAEDTARADGGALDPNTVPPLTIHAGDFRYSGIRLGAMDATIESIPGGLRLSEVSLKGPGFSASAGGRSVLWPAEDLTRLTLEVTSDDVGQALESMGFARSLEASKGRFTTELQWSGGLASDFLAKANGGAGLAIENGSLSEVEPGAGRVFGLLSIQALPRRLTLDFRDVFTKGFHFDELTGDFRIEDGAAYTDNLVFRGPAADIGIVGTVNLVERTYDQVAVLSAELGNTLPLVGAIAAGPAIGAGLFVLKEIFKAPLRGMVQVQYQITGPWNDPVVERMAPAAGEGPPARVTRDEDGVRPQG